MKIRTLTTNEQYVRLDIFEGRLEAHDGVMELLRIERAQHEAERQRHLETIEKLHVAWKRISFLEAGEKGA